MVLLGANILRLYSHDWRVMSVNWSMGASSSQRPLDICEERVPTREIRDKILTSEKVDLLSESAELFYRRLMNVVDDHGRYFADPRLLASACYPLRSAGNGGNLPATIEKLLAECVLAELIREYESGGRKYLIFLSLGHRKRGKSKFPEPPSYDKCRELSENSREFPQVPADSALRARDGDTEERRNGETKERRSGERKSEGKPDFDLEARFQAYQSRHKLQPVTRIQACRAQYQRIVLDSLDPPSTADRLDAHQAKWLEYWSSNSNIRPLGLFAFLADGDCMVDPPQTEQEDWIRDRIKASNGPG